MSESEARPIIGLDIAKNVFHGLGQRKLGVWLTAATSSIRCDSDRQSRHSHPTNMGAVSGGRVSTWSGWNVFLPKFLNDGFVGSRLTAMGTKRAPMNVRLRANAFHVVAF